MFAYNADGNITFDGKPYIFASHGTTLLGLERAKNMAEWLNQCLATVHQESTIKSMGSPLDER